MGINGDNFWDAVGGAFRNPNTELNSQVYVRITISWWQKVGNGHHKSDSLVFIGIRVWLWMINYITNSNATDFISINEPLQ